MNFDKIAMTTMTPTMATLMYRVLVSMERSRMNWPVAYNWHMIGRNGLTSIDGSRSRNRCHWLAALYKPISAYPPGVFTSMALAAQETGATVTPVSTAGRAMTTAAAAPARHGDS